MVSGFNAVRQSVRYLFRISKQDERRETGTIQIEVDYEVCFLGPKGDMRSARANDTDRLFPVGRRRKE